MEGAEELSNEPPAKQPYSDKSQATIKELMIAAVYILTYYVFDDKGPKSIVASCNGLHSLHFHSPYLSSKS